MDRDAPKDSDFPVAAGMLFGLGARGVLRWDDSALSAPVAPHADQCWTIRPITCRTFKVTTCCDNFLHLSTYLFPCSGLLMLRRAAYGGTSRAVASCSTE